MTEEITETNKKPILEKALYSKREAGEVTCTSESTIHRAIKANKLHPAFLNKRVVIRGAELLRWVQSCEGKGGLHESKK